MNQVQPELLFPIAPFLNGFLVMVIVIVIVAVMVLVSVTVSMQREAFSQFPYRRSKKLSHRPQS
jgi:hypothetical protein